MENEITLLIADDHPMVRAGLRSMLSDSRIKIAGEASSGREALEMVMRLKPKVILMDIRMPDMDGIQALEAIKAAKLETRVIMVTTYRSTAYLLRSLSAGAAGFVLKDISREELLAAVYSIAQGTSLVDSLFLQDVLRNLESAEKTNESPEDLIEPLTAREMDILRLMVEGLTNQAIGDVLGISAGTVKGYAQTVMHKLGTNDRTQAAVKAIRLGLVK
ncbi:MAG: response regulator transcription factor, partial [Chloroflexi bacterium]|nr:response regulator transcription factor [Chloroflexota bacterium]MBI3166884.1 response regulator transcription factor [Chloroflexota bacterium]